MIAAAFVGPGTVTTAASAGCRFGFALLWALLFSTVSCLVLQEASARLTLVSGLNLGEALRRQYTVGFQAAALLLLVLGAIVLGCAAYEAGNILGAVAGAALTTSLPPSILVVASVAVAGGLLWFNSPRTVARLLSLLVAVMGAAFLLTALRLGPPSGPLLEGALLPSLPPGSGLLALGLVGTTVVPYNIFLGSGIAGGQSLREMRFGLAVAVGLGGLISMGVLVVGSAVAEPFSFEALARLLEDRLGKWGRTLFAAGLFSAGLSSAITAPLAAAITARSLFGSGESARRWGDRSWRYRGVWAVVLLVGLGFGLSDVRPIPAIILAQALNGVLLPLVTVFLLLAVNDRRLMGDAGRNGAIANSLAALVVAVTLLLGVAGVARAGAWALGLAAPSEAHLVLASAVISLLLAHPILRAVRARRGS